MKSTFEPASRGLSQFEVEVPSDHTFCVSESYHVIGGGRALSPCTEHRIDELPSLSRGRQI